MYTIILTMFTKINFTVVLSKAKDNDYTDQT